jgi:AsmA protein
MTNAAHLADAPGIIAFAEALADLARGLAQVHFRSTTAYERKADDSPVTVADRAIELALRAAIAERYPDDGILDAVEGRGNISVDLTADGPTVNALKKSLDGTARVELKDGAVKGINLTEALRKTRAAFGSKSAQQQASDTSARTDFSALSASFVVKDGVARNDDLDVRAPLVRVGGAGAIDIGQSKLDYLAKATVVATSKGQGGADLEHLSGLTIPVKLTGPFDAPKYEIDYGALAGDAAKAKLKQKVEKAEEKIEKKVEDKLRNLLKR